MIRIEIAITSLLALALIVAACAPATPSATPTPIGKATTVPVGTAKPSGTGTAAPAATPAAPASTTPTAPPKASTLKFGTIQSISDAGVYIAMEKGYFKQEAITIESVNFRNASEAIPALGTGQIDFLGTPLSSALLAAADRGIDIKIVSDKGQSLPNWEFAWILLRKDLADSGQVKTGADLKGMKIAIPSQGSLGDQTMQMFLEQSGVKTGEVDIVILPQSEHAAAFANKAIAASYAVEPYIARGVQEGFAVKWIPQNQFYGGRAQVANVVFGPTPLKDKDLSQRWMVAYLRGVRDYLKAFTTKEGRQDVVNILVKHTTVTEPKLYDVMEMPYLDPNGTPDKKSIDLQYKWLQDKGVYKGTRTFDDITDLSFVNSAFQKLGKQ